MNTCLPTIGIIGSKGKMGAMLSKNLLLAGYTVHGLNCKNVPIEPNVLPEYSQEEMKSFFAQSAIILLCIPVTAIEKALEVFASYLSIDQHILMDITSVKVLPMQVMEKAFAGRVIGTHPLFGPEPKSEDKKVALVKGAKADSLSVSYTEALFTALNCSFFWTTAKEHDQGVAFAQSLNFTVSAAFFCALGRHENIRPFLTPSFKRHLEAARKHLTQDTAMFLEFSSMNPCFSDALDTYRDVLSEVAKGNLEQVATEAADWYNKGI